MLSRNNYWVLIVLLWLVLLNSVANPQISRGMSIGDREEFRSKNAENYSPLSESSSLNKLSGGSGLWKKDRVAIVIDDFGQRNATGAEEILTLGIPVTCAIMPNLENTRKHADEAVKKGHQVIVHLPLEPVKGKKSWLGPGAITMKLTEEEIKYLVRKDFDSVPHAVGFNNHMGSAATSTDKIMRPILQVAQERNFFVLDSRTTGKSRIPAVSKELGIPCIERNVFLDNVKSSKYVKKQLFELSQEALKNGKAIGIGHVGLGGKVTANALKEMIPQMKEMGIEFVYLSEIVY